MTKPRSAPSITCLWLARDASQSMSQGRVKHMWYHRIRTLFPLIVHAFKLRHISIDLCSSCVAADPLVNFLNREVGRRSLEQEHADHSRVGTCARGKTPHTIDSKHPQPQTCGHGHVPLLHFTCETFFSTIDAWCCLWYRNQPHRYTIVSWPSWVAGLPKQSN